MAPEDQCEDPHAECAAEIKRLQAWVDDLHSNMYINCVYCGWRAGEKDTVGRVQLQAHVEQCPEHPLSKARAENAALRARVEQLQKLAEPVWDGRNADE